MIVGYREPGQQLAVGNMVYERITESNMVSFKTPCLHTSMNDFGNNFCGLFQDIVCLCCPAVDELMWGLKISLRNFVPTERCGLTNEDRLQMNQGMKSFLNIHNFGIKPDMMVSPSPPFPYV